MGGDLGRSERRDLHVTKGEGFDCRDLWPFLAETLGMESAPDAPVSLAEFLPTNAEARDRVVAKHGLQPNAMTELLGESHHLVDLVLGYGLTEPPPAAFVSSIKIRQAHLEMSAGYEVSASIRPARQPGPAHALAWILLHGRIDNMQTPWVKLGVDGTLARLPMVVGSGSARRFTQLGSEQMTGVLCGLRTDLDSTTDPFQIDRQPRGAQP